MTLSNGTYVYKQSRAGSPISVNQSLLTSDNYLTSLGHKFCVKIVQLLSHPMQIKSYLGSSDNCQNIIGVFNAVASISKQIFMILSAVEIICKCRTKISI